MLMVQGMQVRLNKVSSLLNLINFKGIIYFNEGEYEGEIKEGKAFGEGVFSRDGDVWIGTFLDNQFHGYCK